MLIEGGTKLLLSKFTKNHFSSGAWSQRDMENEQEGGWPYTEFITDYRNL